MRTLYSILLLISLLSLSQIAQAQQERRFIIFGDDGVQAGEQVVTRSENGQVDVQFVYKNNGRGPEINETIFLNSDGTMASYLNKGSSTFGSRIDESFSIDGDQASWRAGVKEGSTTFTGSPMYWPVDSSLEVLSVAIASMAKQGIDELPLLPGGVLKKTMVKEVDISVNDKNQTVQLLSLSGIGMTPQFAWVTKGEDARLFAYIVPGAFYFVEQEWRESSDKLAQIQSKENALLLNNWAQDLPTPLEGLTVIKNTRIFDSESLALSSPKDIYIHRGKISLIAVAGEIDMVVDNSIDAKGRIALPGLFDMHGHISRWEGGLHLAAGVTTLRDLGNDNQQMQLMMDEIAQGKLLAPHIVPTGFLEGESPFSARIGVVISNLKEAKDAINWYATHNYYQIKIYNSFPKEILSETVDYAHSKGLRVSGHVPAFLKAEDVVKAGFDEIQHINQIVLNFLVKPDTDTRTLDRFYLPAREFADFDLQSKEMTDFIKLLKDNKVIVDPTLATFDFLKRVDGVVGDPFKAIIDHLPPDVQRAKRTAELDIPDAETAKIYEKSYQKMVELVGIMYRAGIPIVPGTDELAGFTLQGELELLVKAGLSPQEALQVATRDSANISQLGDSKGQIKTGFDADILLVNGDPTQDISDIRQLVMVITQGNAYYPSTIYEYLGIRPFTDDLPSITHTKATME